MKCTFAKSITKASSSTTKTSSHPSPNWRATPTVVTIVTSLCGPIPVRIVDWTGSRGEARLIIVIVKFAPRRHHSRGDVVVEMRRHGGSGGTRGRMKCIGRLLVWRWSIVGVAFWLWHVRVLALLRNKRD